MWNKNTFTQKLNIEYPIIQAGMAGGPTTPELVAAVSNAGGMGMLGAGYMTPEAMKNSVSKIRNLTDKPFGVNLFIPNGNVVVDGEAVSQMKEHLKSMGPFGEETIKVHLENTSSEQFKKQLEVILDEKVPIFSFTFGVLGEKETEQLKQQGIFVIGTATTVEEAIQLEKNHVDAIVAQGFEAGGHRGTFLRAYENSFIGTMALVPQVVDNVRIPVIASGGIMDGRGIVASLALGASAVQMGTAFLASQESGAHPKYKQAVLQSRDTDTVMTKMFSGKPARGIQNTFIESMQGYKGDIPVYPIQNALTRPMRNWAKQEENSEYMSLWAGQASSLSSETTAFDIVLQLVKGTEHVLKHLR